MMRRFHNPHSNYAFEITYIRDDDELVLATYLLNKLTGKRDDPENKKLSQENYKSLIDSYNGEIKWLTEKISEYNSRKNIRNHL
jgi:ribonucleotide reductase beta subunit family protein with ferritin-like domain